MIFKFISWIFSKLRNFFGSKAGKITAAAVGAFGVGAAGVGAVQTGKAVRLNRGSKKMCDEALQRHEEHYNKVQGALESAGAVKLTAIESFDDFADQMAKIQGRPEFDEIICKGVKLPEFTANDLKVISNNVAFAIKGAAGAGAGIGLGIAVCGLNLVALGPGLLIGGIGLFVAGGHIKKKAIESNKQAKQLAKDVDALVKQYDELATAAALLEKHISAVYAQYDKHLAMMKKILSKKTRWGDMTDKEKNTIENTILLVGMLLKLCKIELIVKEQKTETINAEEVEAISAEVDVALKHTKPKLFFT
ncbi:MAG: hypothetical protein ACI3XL_05950 [Eubacteriales bacterium]